MSIKPTKLTIKNIGTHANTEIHINKPLILFYGEIRTGKTTILNAVRWVCGGAFPDDIIKHGEKEGSIELEFDGGMIARSWYRNKEGKTVARAVQFIKAGKPVASPVAEIKRLLNPFLLDQDFLRNKSELERKQYFTELFAVDTTELDKELFNAERDATALRSKISGYGEIDLTAVEAVDISELQSKRSKIMSDYADQKSALEGRLQTMQAVYEKDCQGVDSENDLIRQHNATQERATATKGDIEQAIAGHEKAIKELRARLTAIAIEPLKELKPRPAAPDRSEIQKKLLDIVPDMSALDKQVQDAGATNVRAEQYHSNKKRAEQQAEDVEKLSALVKRGKEIKAAKQAKLAAIGETCGIKELSFDESGNFIYQGTTAGMISDSQIMRLSSELSALYPDGFGLDLIDRGESLGKSIFEFVERAKTENKSILATIVGERPAKVPDDVGVFVVESGVVK